MSILHTYMHLYMNISIYILHRQLGPLYEKTLYKEYLTIQNCTELDGTVNSLLEEQIGLCWGNGECFTSNIGKLCT